MEDPTGGWAKATEETAKASGKLVDAGRAMGGFIARYIGGSLEQGMGIFEDKLKYIRWERQARLAQRAEAVMREIGMNGPTRALPLKLAVPLLQGAAMEDNDELQNRWVNLLVNATNADSGIDLQRSYIAILESLTPLEARILDVIYTNGAVQQSLDVTLLTKNLPDSVSVESLDDQKNVVSPNETIQMALANLAAAGCLEIERTMNGRELFGLVLPRLLGKKFVEACTLRY